MQKHLEVLQDFGLSLNEAKIYETLLDLNEAGVGEISTTAKVHRRNAYDAINRLVEKGLIFSVLSKGDHIYSAVEPTKLVELVKEKEEKLNKILPDLRARHQAQRVNQEAYIYKGLEGFKNYMRDLLRLGEEAYFVGAKLGWFDPRLRNFTNQFLTEAKRKNIKFNHIFDSKVKTAAPGFLKMLKNEQTPFKFLPKEYSTTSAIDIFGDQVVTFTGLHLGKLDDDVTLFVLRDKQLADSYKTWFKFMWDHSEELEANNE